MTIVEALRHGADRLRLPGIDNPRLEARLLLAHALCRTQADLLLAPRADVVDATAFESMLDRRAAHEPLALILGHREFWSLEFAVSPATLIPRPDSETLVEAAIAAFAGRTPPQRILDLGTGTGCLLLAVLQAFPAAFGIGIDIAPAAASLAATNARTLCFAARSAFLAGNWTDALNARFDLVLSNPPYIPTADIAGLMPDVALYEPRNALDGGPDGADAYRRIVDALPTLLEPDGVAVLEFGIGQADMVAAMAHRAGFTTATRPDLAGCPRAIVLRRALP